MSKRDLSAVGDVADEVRAMLGMDDLSKATVDHVHRAIYDFLLQSDKTFKEGMETARQTGRKSFRKPLPTLSPEPAEELPESSPEELHAARRVIVPVAAGADRRGGNSADLVAA